MKKSIEFNVKPDWDEIEKVRNESADFLQSHELKDAKTSIKILKALKKIGIKLVIDDFGTSYSSFSSLRLFPLDDLKISRSFIQNLAGDKECYEIVKTMVNLAKKLGLKVVAAGVETERHLNKVISLNFDMVQGFPFAKPADKDSVVKLFNPPFKADESSCSG